jgi:flagellar assembly factor FliW
MNVKIGTTRFGEIEVPLDRIIEFPQGLIGFSDVRRYALVDNPSGGPFQWLQAVDRPGLAFVITDPRVFFPDYTVPVRAEDLATIRASGIDEAVVVVILVVPRDPERITANLQGPIVINLRERLARQLVIDLPGYTTRQAIFSRADGGDAARKPEEASC